MLITPFSPALVAGKRFQHGSNLDGKTRAARVSSQWKSTSPNIDKKVTLRYPGAQIEAEQAPIERAIRLAEVAVKKLIGFLRLPVRKAALADSQARICIRPDTWL
jgi:hypothetical protein